MERFFNGYKLKYDQLNAYLLPIRAARKVKVINIFINLDDLIHKLHTPLINHEFQCCGISAYKQMISNLINLMAHYRNYAIKESMIPNIYLIYTTNRVFKNNGHIQGYREYYNKITEPNVQDFMHVNNTVIESIRILPVITKYIQGIYSINTMTIEPSCVPFFLGNYVPAQLNIMVSRDEYDLQYSYLDNWVYISPKGENSTFVVGGSMWDYLYRKHNIESEYKLHPELFVYAKAILGDKYRSIPKPTRTGWKTIIKYLVENTKHLGLSPDTVPLQKKAIVDFIEKKNINRHSYDTNIYCTSVKRQVDALTSTETMLLTQQIVDFPDMQSIQELNHTTFQQYPLNLDFLFKVSTNQVAADKYIWQQ